MKQTIYYKEIPLVTGNMDETLIVTYSPKYKAYQQKLRSRQIERAEKIILEGNVEQVLKINKRRWEIEENFQIMKSEFEARPVYVRRDDRIKAHFLTCYISLLVYRLLEKELGPEYTCERISRVPCTKPLVSERTMNSYPKHPCAAL